MLRYWRTFTLPLCLSAALYGQLAPASDPDPEIRKMVREVSQDRIAAIMQKLSSFGTRGNFTDPNQEERGIGAARRWIYEQFRSYSPRLEVAYDPHKVKKQGTRILRAVEVVNVVAVLPGTTLPEKRVIISGHYDSLNVVRKAGAPPPGTTGGEGGDSVDDVIDFEKSVDAPAPGVTDDASGASVVMELARVMSQYQFEKTIVFVTFAGEEIGLIGSTLYADKAKKRGDQIEAVLNNDIVGCEVAGDGRADSRGVRVFSDDPVDSPSRELARYVRGCAQRYVPGFAAEPVFRADRFSRGGDHTPFVSDGYAGVRFTSVEENLDIQHTAKDTFEKASASYTTNVARVNVASAASLALAPAAPVTFREIATGASKGRKVPNLTRGKSRYDALLRWKDPKPAHDLVGYAVV
ncbi:MAG TPA: M28 family peptidase, partial [Bryobacteraceae bacterium]